MSNTEDLAAKLDTLNSIPAESVRAPYMPVDEFLQQAENLVITASQDSEALGAVGLDTSLITDLPTRIGATRESQSIWEKKFRKKLEAQKEWSEKAPLGYALRDEIERAFRFYFRSDDDKLSTIRRIAKGRTNSDMIQDLNDLAVLGADSTEFLTEKGFDISLLTQATESSNELAVILAEATGEKGDSSADKILRDRAFTHLFEAVNEILETGRYVFYGDKIRAKLYRRIK